MDRRRIQQLSASLVNRIAAGEVIERPAAVVKELVENAIDAGAANIRVEVEDGGRELVRVIDDGSGIEPADLQLAFASHATSKLVDDDDLFRIGTMGFRGEALASIGSVSHSRILSRTGESQAGYEVFNRGGAITDAQAAAGNVGTVVEVRNLFFNVPARRKFIKGTATEFGHISEILMRLAMPFPRVAFSLFHNNRKTFELPATDPVNRWLAGWPDDFREQQLPIDARDAELRLRGIVGLPALARPTGKYQYFYLNGRHVRDKLVQHALREAFRGLTEPGRYPAAVLMLEMPPADVDVNVHPTKIEVRFRDGQRIHGLVLSAVRERLLGSDLTPSAVPGRTDFSRPATAAQPAPERQEMQRRLADFFKQEPAAPPPLIAPPDIGEAPARTSTWVPSTSVPSTLVPSAPPDWASRPARGNDASVAQHNEALANAQPNPDQTSPPGSFAPPPEVSADRPAPRSPIGTLPGAPAIQLHNSYLVAQSDDGMIIIDQHALHERIMYEELLARVTRGPLEAQRLLIPLVVPANARQLALLDQVRPQLERLGVEVNAFGPDSVAIHSFPSFLHRLDPATFVTELLERGEQELLDLHGEELLHEVLDMMACKAAVKAGDPLTAAEIEALLARRDLVDRSSNCPHGRPTTLRLSLRDLDKQFKRTGF